MEVYVQRIVFGAEINSFGLSEREVLEIAGKVVRTVTKDSAHDWELNDVKSRKNKTIVVLEVSRSLEIYSTEEMILELRKRAREIFNEIERALEDYAYVKQFLTVYYNCNGHNGRNGTREVLEKVGIPVL